MIEDNHSKGNRIMEEIIDKEIDKESKVLYKVKWKDMDVSLSTWEPIELLGDIEILQAYGNKRKGLNSELNEIGVKKEPQELGMKQKRIIDDDSNQRREAENDDDDEVIDINHTNANLTDKEMIKENYDNNKNTDNDFKNNDEPHIESMLTQRKRKRENIKNPLSISKSKSLSYSNPKSLQKGNLCIDIPLTIKTAKQNPKNPK